MPEARFADSDGRAVRPTAAARPLSTAARALAVGSRRLRGSLSGSRRRRGARRHSGRRSPFDWGMLADIDGVGVSRVLVIGDLESVGLAVVLEVDQAGRAKLLWYCQFHRDRTRSWG